MVEIIEEKHVSASRSIVYVSLSNDSQYYRLESPLIIMKQQIKEEIWEKVVVLWFFKGPVLSGNCVNINILIIALHKMLTFISIKTR